MLRSEEMGHFNLFMP